MIWFPFVCLVIGAIIGSNKSAGRIMKCIDFVINIGVIVLMLTLGVKIGSNDILFGKLGLIGLHCFTIAALAIAGSILFTVLLERTILPLSEVRMKLVQEKSMAEKEGGEPNETRQSSPLIWIMPGSIIAGIAGGYWVMPAKLAYLLDYVLAISLVGIYIGVGVSFGVNKGVFQYLKILNWRITLISVTVIIGSLIGGGFAGILLDLPMRVTILASAGMSYYSITGSMLTQAYGIEVGVYGFLVNVAREFMTVLLVPILVRISLGSPIAAGAAGDMDTMLVPVTKFVGVELGLVTLITGTILTFIIPFLLSLLMYGIGIFPD